MSRWHDMIQNRPGIQGEPSEQGAIDNGINYQPTPRPTPGTPGKKPGGCKGGCSKGDKAHQAAMDALQAQLDKQLAVLQSGELAFQKYLEQAELDRQKTLDAQKILDDELKKRQEEQDAIEQERKDRYSRGKRDLLRYVAQEDEDSDMLALGGQL